MRRKRRRRRRKGGGLLMFWEQIVYQSATILEAMHMNLELHSCKQIASCNCKFPQPVRAAALFGFPRHSTKMGNQQSN